MNEIDKLIVVTAATITITYLIGPAAWRIVKTVAECALVITVFVWML